MIWIFGDSFSANTSDLSWTTMLAAHYDVTNLASNGSSEYRIWKTYQNHKHKIIENDIVIFCHTSSSRIFLKDTETLLSRLLGTHRNCDLIINDVFSKRESKFIKVLRTIWDEDFFNDTYNLYLDNLLLVPNSIHFTFFDSNKVETFKDIWASNPGTINHMTPYGNTLILDKITCIISTR